MDIKKLINRELVNDVLTGLLVAAAFASAVPHDAMAQYAAGGGGGTGLSSAVNTSKSSVFSPFMAVVTYASYGLGTVMTVAGIANSKKHADNPSSNPLAPAIGKLGAGAAFLAAPTVIGMLQSTASTTTGGNGFSQGTVPGLAN